MTEIDEFASSLLEQSKRFLEKANDRQNEAATQAYLDAAMMLAFCALEAHTNAIADDFSTRSDLTPSDKGVLLEKEIRLDNGEFTMGGLRMYRLEDRILFLHRRFGGKPLDRTTSWWSELSSAVDLRNQLTHPKKIPDVTLKNVTRAIQAIIEAIDALFQAIYHTPFPSAKRGLQSRFSF
jgi:hypothetical protein